MAGKYRGVLKVSGPVLRGWLIDVARPSRRVRFNLVVDGEPRGSYVADTRRRFFAPQTGRGEDTHAFSVPIRKPWISGGFQSLRLEDTADSGLIVAMTAKLGPRPNQTFDDNVLGGQVSVGADQGPRAEDEPEAEAASVNVNRALLRQIATLSDADLVNLLVAVDRDVLAERLARHEKSGEWERLAEFRRAVAGSAGEKLLNALGRGAIRAHNHAFAGRVTAAAAALYPQSFESLYLAGSAKSLQGEFDEALRYLGAADRLEKDGVRAKREIALTLTRQLRGELGVERRAQIREEHLAVLRALSTADDPVTQLKYRVPFATALYAAGKYDDAIAAADAVLAAAPNDGRALAVKARTLIAKNQIAEAHALYERMLELDPGHRGARVNLRVLAALLEDDARAQDGAVATVEYIGRIDRGAPAAQVLAGLPQPWICFGDDADDRRAAASLAAAASRRVGFVRLDAREFWHRDALRGLAESGLIATLDDRDALARWQPFYQGRPRPGGPGVAVLASRNGADLYGGGERFLEDAAAWHARQGFETIIVGTRAELEGARTSGDGQRACFIGERPADLRRFLLENKASLVHAISGMGFAAAEALAFTNIPLIYGVHFWNELLGDPDRAGYFDEVSGDALFRREFLVILSRAATVYANSRFTQKIIEDGFGVRCPVLFAVPRDAAPAAAPGP